MKLITFLTLCIIQLNSYASSQDYYCNVFQHNAHTPGPLGALEIEERNGQYYSYSAYYGQSSNIRSSGLKVYSQADLRQSLSDTPNISPLDILAAANIVNPSRIKYFQKLFIYYPYYADGVYEGHFSYFRHYVFYKDTSMSASSVLGQSGGVYIIGDKDLYSCL